MKIFITAIFLIIGTSLVQAEDAADPFAYIPPKEVDRSTDKDSSEFLSDDLLDALEERRLDKQAPEFNVRITILRSFDSPLVFIWAMEEQGSWIQVKRARMQTNASGNRIYDGLEVNKLVTLSLAKNSNIQTLLEHANINGLPQDCWQPESLDGSTWIYEIFTADGWCLLKRRNPINPTAALQDSTISKERLVQESNLTAFALMLWAFSGIEDDKLY